MLLNVGPSTAFFVSTSTGAVMETAARECDAADDRAGSWSAAEEKVDARNSIPGGRRRCSGWTSQRVHLAFAPRSSSETT